MKVERTHLIFLYLLFLLIGCQKEIVEIIDPSTDEVITSNSNVTALIAMATLRDGSFDNIMDRASCTSIVLPVSVLVNGRDLVINSMDDFEAIKAIFDESETDVDELSFFYPINAILPDHSEVIVSNEDELEDLTEDCVEDGSDDDIECVDFEYPVSVSVFNTNTQIAEVFTFASDKEVYQFTTDLGADDLVGIDFPLTLILLDGTELVANDTNELEAIIESNRDQCDEDDDDDYDDDDDNPGSGDLVSVLLGGEWAVGSFLNNGIDQTGDFTGYVFTFNADGTALADNGSNQINGTWSHKEENNSSQELTLDFGGTATFIALQDDWDVEDYDSAMIKLMDEDTAGGSTRFLTLEKQ